MQRHAPKQTMDAVNHSQRNMASLAYLDVEQGAFAEAFGYA